MQSDSILYIEKLLDNLDPIRPIPTETQPNFRKDETIKAIILDIYGTMLISSSGDIDRTELSEKNLKTALDAAGIKITDGVDDVLNQILQDFEYTVRICHEAARKNNVPYPEIDILSVWKIILIHSRRKKLIDYKDDVDIMLLTCVFEFLSNHVYPMPELHYTIEELHKKSMPLGIVSNAQFYTPVLLNYYLNGLISLNEKVRGFDKDLTVFSYKLGKGKPDPSLFEELIPTLKWKYGIIPSEVLFIGNDMLKDIYTSKQVGFKTALFAGDKRSLRMHENDKRTTGVKPDYIITEIKQLLEIVL